MVDEHEPQVLIRVVMGQEIGKREKLLRFYPRVMADGCEFRPQSKRGMGDIKNRDVCCGNPVVLGRRRGRVRGVGAEVGIQESGG